MVTSKTVIQDKNLKNLKAYQL